MWGPGGLKDIGLPLDPHVLEGISLAVPVPEQEEPDYYQGFCEWTDGIPSVLLPLPLPLPPTPSAVYDCSHF